MLVSAAGVECGCFSSILKSNTAIARKQANVIVLDTSAS